MCIGCYGQLISVQLSDILKCEHAIVIACYPDGEIEHYQKKKHKKQKNKKKPKKKKTTQITTNFTNTPEAFFFFFPSRIILYTTPSSLPAPHPKVTSPLTSFFTISFAVNINI